MAEAEVARAESIVELRNVRSPVDGVIVDPVTLPPEATAAEAARIMDERNIGGVPITVGGILKGILTRRDLRFLDSPETKIEEVMTRDNLVTAPEETLLEDARVRTQTVAGYQEDMSDSFGSLTRYLGLVGLAALVLGSIGVAAGVRVFVREKLDGVAMLRSIGASPALYLPCRCS